MKPEPPKTVATRRVAIVSKPPVASGLIRRERRRLNPGHLASKKSHPMPRKPLTPPQRTATSPALPQSQRGRTVAQVAELVDAQVSGTCGRKVVEVRVFSWAPIST